MPRHRPVRVSLMGLLADAVVTCVMLSATARPVNGLPPRRGARMDFDDTPDEAAYRARGRSLPEEHAAELAPLAAGEEAADAGEQEQALRRTQRVLADAGLVGVSWA